jgi:2'-5' RNA ligase
MTLSRLAIVAYPTLNEPDREWIDEVRRAHDPQASRIDAHFTLVFPVDAVASAIADELAAVAALARPIRFAIRRAEAVRDVVLGTGGHVLLVPDEGREQITELHDQLYAGALQPHLRADIRFVPHMTVGATSDFERCQQLAEALNEDQRIVRGILDSITLVNVAATPVQPVTVADLKL